MRRVSQLLHRLLKAPRRGWERGQSSQAEEAASKAAEEDTGPDRLFSQCEERVPACHRSGRRRVSHHSAACDCAIRSKGSDVTHLIAAAEASLTSFSKSDGLDHDHAVQPLVRIGTPFSEILAAAAENDVELIVLGVHDAAPLRGLALGHTAERVSRYAPCPVLLVRESRGDRAVSKSAAGAEPAPRR